MRWRPCLVAGAVLLGTVGCGLKAVDRPFSTAVLVRGTVRYPLGAPCWMARVSTVEGDSTYSTFTDSLGAYRLLVPASKDSLTLNATDAYQPLPHFETRYYRVNFLPNRDQAVDIVLLWSVPF